MLTSEQNGRLVRVGPGQPAGEMFRRYWQPALLCAELPESDCAPVRVRLLGEDLIAFRDSSGAVGLVDAYCPHRRAPMFFGRNEECGLRCVYHGWKFDRNGDCIDMPSEPAGTPLQVKVKIKSYPTHEQGGIIWSYMGPKDLMPSPPDFEWTRAPATHRDVTKTLENCNYLQGLEGGLDTTHASFLHNNSLGAKNLLRQRDKTPRIEIELTNYGYAYASLRSFDADRLYVRAYHYVMPNHQVRANLTAPGGDQRYETPMIEGHTWVPVDDEHTYVYNWTCGYDHNAPLSREYNDAWNARNGRGPDDFVPGTYSLKQCKENDYLIDRAVQKSQTYTGIKGVNTQDWAVQEGMGAIVDRSLENLGTSDKAIVAMRSVARGEKPCGAEAQCYRHVRPYDDFIPVGADWKQAFASHMIAKW